MTKQELRVGYLAVFRNGQASAVKCDGISDGSLPFVKGFTLGDYTDTLTHREYPDYDLTEVYGWPDSKPKSNRLALYFKKNRPLLWKRENDNAVASLSSAVAFANGDVLAARENDRLILHGTYGGLSFVFDLCPCGSEDELITGGERIDYEIFRCLQVAEQDGAVLVTVHTETGNAVYRKNDVEVTAESRRKVYSLTLTKKGFTLTEGDGDTV